MSELLVYVSLPFRVSFNPSQFSLICAVNSKFYDDWHVRIGFFFCYFALFFHIFVTGWFVGIDLFLKKSFPFCLILKTKLAHFTFVLSKILPISVHLLSQLVIDRFKELLILPEVVSVYGIDIIITKKYLRQFLISFWMNFLLDMRNVWNYQSKFFPLGSQLNLYVF